MGGVTSGCKGRLSHNTVVAVRHHIGFAIHIVVAAVGTGMGGVTLFGAGRSGHDTFIAVRHHIGFTVHVAVAAGGAGMGGVTLFGTGRSGHDTFVAMAGGLCFVVRVALATGNAGMPVVTFIGAGGSHRHGFALVAAVDADPGIGNIHIYITVLHKSTDRTDTRLDTGFLALALHFGGPALDGMLSAERLSGHRDHFHDLAADLAGLHREAVTVHSGNNNHLPITRHAFMRLYHIDNVSVEVAFAVLNVQGAAGLVLGNHVNHTVTGKGQNAILINSRLVVGGQQEVIRRCDNGRTAAHIIPLHPNPESHLTGGVLGLEPGNFIFSGLNVLDGLFLADGVIQTGDQLQIPGHDLIIHFTQTGLNQGHEILAHAGHAEIVGTHIRNGIGPRNAGGIVLILGHEHTLQNETNGNCGNRSSDGVKQIKLLGGSGIFEQGILHTGNRADHRLNILQRILCQPFLGVGGNGIQRSIQGRIGNACRRINGHVAAGNVGGCKTGNLAVKHLEQSQLLLIAAGGEVKIIQSLQAAVDAVLQSLRSIQHRLNSIDCIDQLFNAIHNADQFLQLMLDDIRLKENVHTHLDDDFVTGVEFSDSDGCPLRSGDPFLLCVVRIVNTHSLFKLDHVMNVVQGDIRHIGQSNRDRVILCVEGGVWEVKMQVHSIAGPDMELILSHKHLIDGLLERHDCALEPSLETVTSRCVASDVPVDRFTFSLGDMVDVLRQRLLLARHGCQGQALRQFQSGSQVFQRIGLGVVDNQHLHIEHFLQPGHFAPDNQVEILADRIHRNDIILHGNTDGLGLGRRLILRFAHIDPASVYRCVVFRNIYTVNLGGKAGILIPAVKDIILVIPPGGIGQRHMLTKLHFLVLAPAVPEALSGHVIMQGIAGVFFLIRENGGRSTVTAAVFAVCVEVEDDALPIDLRLKLQLQLIAVHMLVAGIRGVDARRFDLLQGHLLGSDLGIIGGHIAQTNLLRSIDTGIDRNLQISDQTIRCISRNILLAHRQHKAYLALGIGNKGILAFIFSGNKDLGIADGFQGLGIDHLEGHEAVTGVGMHIDFHPGNGLGLNVSASAADSALNSLFQNSSLLVHSPIAEGMGQLIHVGILGGCAANGAGMQGVALRRTGGGNHSGVVAMVQRRRIPVVLRFTDGADPPVMALGRTGGLCQRYPIAVGMALGVDPVAHVGITADLAGKDREALSGTSGFRDYAGVIMGQLFHVVAHIGIAALRAGVGRVALIRTGGGSNHTLAGVVANIAVGAMDIRISQALIAIGNGDLLPLHLGAAVVNIRQYGAAIEGAVTDGCQVGTGIRRQSHPRSARFGHIRAKSGPGLLRFCGFFDTDIDRGQTIAPQECTVANGGYTAGNRNGSQFDTGFKDKVADPGDTVRNGNGAQLPAIAEGFITDGSDSRLNDHVQDLLIILQPGHRILPAAIRHITAAGNSQRIICGQHPIHVSAPGTAVNNDLSSRGVAVDTGIAGNAVARSRSFGIRVAVAALGAGVGGVTLHIASRFGDHRFVGMLADVAVGTVNRCISEAFVSVPNLDLLPLALGTAIVDIHQSGTAIEGTGPDDRQERRYRLRLRQGAQYTAPRI